MFQDDKYSIRGVGIKNLFDWRKICTFAQRYLKLKTT